MSGDLERRLADLVADVSGFERVDALAAHLPDLLDTR